MATADVQGASNEVYTIARYLFAWNPLRAEAMTAWDVATEADPEWLERVSDPRGKYLKQGDGYIHILENGDGRALSELPDGVSASDVVDVTLDVSSATPLQDRLTVIAQSLRSVPANPNALFLAGLIDDILTACRPDNTDRLFAELKRKAMSEVLDAMGQDATVLVQRGRRFLDELEALLPKLRNGPRGDGRLIGSLLAVSGLIRAVADRAPSAREEAVSLVESISYMAATSPVPPDGVVQGLCRRMIKKAQVDLVRDVADDVKSQGDALIAQALDADARSFYPPLYASTAYELGVVLIATAAAASVEDADDARRWTKLADNAEERAVRAQTSLGFAVRNLDGTAAGLHMATLREVREEQGNDAAWLEAQDLILQLYYPRSELPILLGEQPVPADQRQG